jgi:hypothetical protein
LVAGGEEIDQTGAFRALGAASAQILQREGLLRVLREKYS